MFCLITYSGSDKNNDKNFDSEDGDLLFLLLLMIIQMRMMMMMIKTVTIMW